MINVAFFYDATKKPTAFKINGHGPEYVCSAVSILAINTINCIEKFTDDKFECDYEKKGGLINFKFTEQNVSHDAKILIIALEFGLKNICSEYKKFVCIKEMEV